MAKRFLISIGLILFCLACQPKEKWQTTTLFYFDTICQINLHCSPQQFSSGIKRVKETFDEIEKNFSPGKKNYSSPLVQELLEKAYDVYQASEGTFDITIGPLSRLWGFQDKNYRIPEQEEIKNILKKIGLNKVIREKEKILLPPWTEFDWGGIAKGFGVDLAYQELRKLGIQNGFINAGGDIFCWGKNPDNRAWNIGIKHPRKRGFLGVVSVSNLGIATSGDYQKFFEKHGVRYHHILNPFTGYPASGKQSVTVIGPETVYCDALSTAIFVSSQPEDIIRKYPQYGAIIVDSNGKILMIGKLYSFSKLD
ncbi:MAG: FAD:protein FMN transferase [Candidatus Aminicenantia bacterium]